MQQDVYLVKCPKFTKQLYKILTTWFNGPKFFNRVSICTVAVHYTLKYYMIGSQKFRLKYCRAQNLNMLRVRQSIFHQKIVPCTIL